MDGPFKRSAYKSFKCPGKKSSRSHLKNLKKCLAPQATEGEGGAGHHTHKKKREEGWEGVDDGMRGCTFHPVGLWASSGSKGNSGMTGADFFGRIFRVFICCTVAGRRRRPVTGLSLSAQDYYFCGPVLFGSFRWAKGQ